MPAVRTAVLLGVAASVVLVGVVVSLVLLVADAATWSRPDPAASAAPGGIRTCTDRDLVLAVDDVADDPGDDRSQLALVWRNESTTPCGLDGFPVVDLVGPDTPRFGASRYGSIVNVPRDDVEPGATTLAPGETARSLLRWTPPGVRAPGSDAQEWTPDRLVVSTPGEQRNQSVAWTYGPMLVAGGSRPGVSFGPVG